MGEIFVSYAGEDIERAARVGEFLASRGFSVWWDRKLTAGDHFATVIEDALSKAQAVVVLWSKHSINSHWVQAEASEALERNILVPLVLDGVRPPLEFRKVHSLGFDGWMLDPADSAGEELVRALSQRTGASGRASFIDSSDAILSRLGSQLLSAKTSFELSEGLFELERFLASNPFNPQGRMLQARYKAALASEESSRPPIIIANPPLRSSNAFRRYATAATVLLTIAISSFIGLRVFDEERTSKPPSDVPIVEPRDDLPKGNSQESERTPPSIHLPEPQPKQAARPESKSVQVSLKIAAALRERGAYDEALKALEKARESDPSNPEVRAEIEKTRTACNAEKRLGNQDLLCDPPSPRDP